jgi:hypothetical protein
MRFSALLMYRSIIGVDALKEAHLGSIFVTLL